MLWNTKVKILLMVKLSSSNALLKWKDARNVSFVDSMGNKCYVIVWKAPLKDMDLNVNDTSKAAYDYGSVSEIHKMHAVYYLQYNPQNKMVYGIILDNNHHNYDLNDLIYGILKLNKSDVKYQENSYSSDSSRHYGVDTSPSTIEEMTLTGIMTIIMNMGTITILMIIWSHSVMIENSY